MVVSLSLRLLTPATRRAVIISLLAIIAYRLQAQCTPPNVTISSLPDVCAGSLITWTASEASTFQWNTGATTSSITVSPAVSTTYTVIGSQAVDCSTAASKTIDVKPAPALSVIASSSMVCGNEAVTLTAQAPLPPDGVTGATSSNFTVSPATTKTYVVNGTNTNGGCAKISKTIPLLTTTYSLWEWPPMGGQTVEPSRSQ